MAINSLKIKAMKTRPNTIAMLSFDDLDSFGDISRKRLVLRNESEKVIFYPAESFYMDSIPEGFIGVSDHIMEELKVTEGDLVSATFEFRSPPDSYSIIKKKIKTNQTLTKAEIDAIVHDVTNGVLNPLEKSALVYSQHFQDYSMDEIEYFCRAIADSGETIDFPTVASDKHSLGGVPGNKVSLLIVPILAAAGLLIPKTSSRAITSASGTADTMEALGAKVGFTTDEIIEISKDIGGMICWGGALNLAPADDILIKEVEFPLGINPRSMMIASIMAKKKAFGIEMMVLDVPTGKGCKVENIEEASILSRAFGELGRRLGIRVECGITYGNSPVGHTIGPSLEAREALGALMNPKTASTSLIQKSCALSGILLEMSGKAVRGEGPKLAYEILESGKAYAKFKQMLEAQEADPNLQPSDIEVGQYTYEYKAPSNGWIVELNNTVLTRIARAAGAPNDKFGGIHFLRKKESVKAGETIFRIHASSEDRLKRAEGILSKEHPVTIEGMLLGRI